MVDARGGRAPVRAGACVVSERLCLRCDWTGEGDETGCPDCGAPLYRATEPIGPREVVETPRPRRDTAGTAVRSSPGEAPPEDDSASPAIPAAAADGKWTVIVVAFVVAAIGMAGAFIDRSTPEPSAAPAGLERRSEASESPPAGNGSSDAATSTPTALGGCPPGGPGAPAELQPAVRSQVPGITADYRFQDSLSSSVRTAPDLVEVGQGATAFAGEVVLGPYRTVLRFARGSGLSLAPTARVIESREYTIELLFRLDRLSGYRKIIDFRNATSDNGLYSQDGCLTFYDQAIATRATIEADRYVHIVLTRDASATVVGYVDGIARLSFSDERELAVVDARNDTLRFFSDDSTTDGEYSGGAVSRIRLYDGPIRRKEVRSACAELLGATCGPSTADSVAQIDAISGRRPTGSTRP
jgi:hypothetical protein